MQNSKTLLCVTPENHFILELKGDIKEQMESMIFAKLIKGPIGFFYFADFTVYLNTWRNEFQLITNTKARELLRKLGFETEDEIRGWMIMAGKNDSTLTKDQVSLIESHLKNN